MTKYYLEDNFNFFDELKKMLDDDDSNENINSDEICYITNTPLQKNFFKMNCGHTFNYEPLYKEIYNQKIVQKNYYFHKEPKEQVKKLKHTKYFIKCPYCRSIQNELLEYIPEYGFAKIYGINSDDGYDLYNDYSSNVCGETLPEGVHIKNFTCCINNTNYCYQYKKNYCFPHFRVALKSIKKESSDLKKSINEMIKIIKKKAIMNKKMANKKENKKENNKVKVIKENTDNGCKIMLKTGINKGNICNAKIYKDDCCKRHYKE